ESQLLGSAAAFTGSKQTGIGQFTACGVFLHALAGPCRGSFDIQQVISHLKKLAKATAIVIQTVEGCFIATTRFFTLSGPEPDPQTSSKQSASLAGMDPLQVSQLRGRNAIFIPHSAVRTPYFAFPGQILSLAADHATGPGPGGQLKSTTGSRTRRITLRQRLESQGQQGITGQDCEGFAKLLVTGWLAATQVIIVHGRQVIVNQ